MDERLAAVRAELETGSIASGSLIVLSNVAADADRDQDLAALEEVLGLARAIAAASDGALRDEAQRLVTLVEQRVRNWRPLWWDE